MAIQAHFPEIDMLFSHGITISSHIFKIGKSKNPRSLQSCHPGTLRFTLFPVTHTHLNHVTKDFTDFKVFYTYDLI